MADVPNCPRGRIEELLAKMAGLPNDAPTTPWSREEAYLLKIIESGGGGGGVDIEQTTGQSTTAVMSQKATTDMVFNNGVTTNIKIGANASTSPMGVAIGGMSSAAGDGGVAIGGSAEVSSESDGGVAVGESAKARGVNSVALGESAIASQNGSVALGAGSSANAVGEINVGSSQTSYGYDGTNYRLITGVHDPVNAQDVATKGYVDSHGGGGPTVVQTTGQSTTDVMSQKAVTDIIGDVESILQALNSGNGAQ